MSNNSGKPAVQHLGDGLPIKAVRNFDADSEAESDGNDQYQGRVAIHPKGKGISQQHRQRPSKLTPAVNNSQDGEKRQYIAAASSSWASNRQQNDAIYYDDAKRKHVSSSTTFPRSRTPNMSNVSMNLGSPNGRTAGHTAADIETRSSDRNTKTSHYFEEPSLAPPDVEGGSNTASFKGWLADGLLDILNTAAGFTISTTGTILSPPIAMTKNVILPGVLAIIVDTLDNITPPRIQDWFRILSSSVYNLYSVLKSTEQGQKFRRQLLLVFQNLFEVWSAPESRQVVVDGMVAGVKLADALHTPEMRLFLDQASVLGCRLVDAIGNGKTKQFIQNSSSLAWQGIELSVDPSTVMALAEVTAHLCHALEELDDSFHPTPRSIRNKQNELTYLQTIRLTDYRADCIENVILSSLGVSDEARPDNSYDDHDTVENDGLSMSSIPSNVAYLNETMSQLEINNQHHDQSTWTKCKDKVDVELLREQIIHKGRSLARPHLGGNAGRNEEFSPMRLSSFGENSGSKPVTGSELEDAAARTFNANDANCEAKTANNFRGDGTERDKRGLFYSFEEQNMRRDDNDEPTEVKFYRAVDDLLQEKRMKALNRGTKIDGGRIGGARHPPGVVKHFRGNQIQIEPNFKSVHERYSNLKRLRKYPPFLLYTVGIILTFVLFFWFAFGLFGFYKFYQGVHQEVPIFTTTLFGGFPPPETPKSNEFVIRIVKEIVHVNSVSDQPQEVSNMDVLVDENVGFTDEVVESIVKCLQ